MTLPRISSLSVPVAFTVDSGLGIITLQDGTGTNRLDGPILSSLVRAMELALDDSFVKIILLRSGESAFCLGMNLDVLQESLETEENLGAENGETVSGKKDQPDDQSGDKLGDRPSSKVPKENQENQDDQDPRESRSNAVSLYARLLHLIAFGPKPVIGLVEGPVKAGGVGITAACDIVVALDGGASFELSEVLFGLIPANVLPYLMNQRISPQAARYLVLSAKNISATEALGLGLVDQLFSRDGIEKGLRNLVKTMMRAEPRALEAAKSFIGTNLQTPMGEFREAAQEKLLELMKQPQIIQGLDAFSRGDTPPWFGRFKPEQTLSGEAARRKETSV